MRHEPEVGDRIELAYLRGCFGRIVSKELIETDFRGNKRHPWTAYSASCGPPVSEVISLHRNEFMLADAVGALAAVANGLSIYVTIEYGYVDAEWFYPGTLHELFTDYAAGNTPFSRGSKKARGYYIEDSPKGMRDYSIIMTINEEDDSSIAFGSWEIDPEWSTDKTRFIPKFKLNGLPGRAKFDAVTALAMRAEDAA